MYKKKIKRDFFITVFCGMKAQSLWVVLVFLRGYVFTLAEVLRVQRTTCCLQEIS